MNNNAFTEYINLNGFSFFKITYNGALPPYKAGDIDSIKQAKKYYFEATSNSFDFKTNFVKFNKAIIHIRHHFKNKIIRDLDNRNRKYIIDAIRYANLIDDDDWQHLSLHEDAVLNPVLNCVEVFVGAQENYIDLLKYLESIDTIREDLEQKQIMLDDERIQEEVDENVIRVTRETIRKMNRPNSPSLMVLTENQKA
ncbi:hypothetical protein ACQKM9_17270 [Viridibacillus sp. NPDC093762]|uniref:hypothetical protein n=1 Tax=Viridibacillus sp. NPDC093762 TaxID=3390720 RepID=UPI003D06AE21